MSGPFVTSETTSHGENYPLDTDCYVPTGENRLLSYQRLKEESLRLFQVAGGGVDVFLRWGRDHGRAQG